MNTTPGTVRHLLTALALCAVAAACSDSPTSPSSGGTFNLRMTDAPFDDAMAVLVTFSEVSVHLETDADFTPLPFADGGGARTCDLKKLQGTSDVLGVGTVEAGHYTQVRLTVSSAALYFDNPSTGDPCAPTIAAPAGASAALDIPSGVVRLNRQFTVPEGGATTMLLDFDGARSITETGNGSFRMTPVIEVVSVD